MRVFLRVGNVIARRNLHPRRSQLWQVTNTTVFRAWRDNVTRTSPGGVGVHQRLPTGRLQMETPCARHRYCISVYTESCERAPQSKYSFFPTQLLAVARCSQRKPLHIPTEILRTDPIYKQTVQNVTPDISIYSLVSNEYEGRLACLAQFTKGQKIVLSSIINMQRN